MNAGRRLSEQQGIAYAKTVAEAMNVKLDMDNPADREKLRRAILDLVAGRKMRKQKRAWLKFSRSLCADNLSKARLEFGLRLSD